MSPYVLKCWLLVAASIALPSCASQPPEVQASDYRPMLGSKLVTRTEPTFVQVKVRQGEQWVTVLARRDTAGDPVPVAVMRYADDRDASFVSVQFIPNPNNPALNVLALEQLYALMLRHDALGRYCLTTGPSDCEASRRRISHDALLNELAEARKGAASSLGLPFEMTPWRSISMRPVTLPRTDLDQVAVQVLGANGPMPGVMVYFNRAPHSVCAARTSADGVAACRLVDQHGDDGDHDEEAHSRVIVTYPGEVRPELVLLPTTYVLPARTN